MTNSELSYKLKYILNELGVNKQEFLKLCQKFSPSLSKPTVLNAINGKNTTLPTIETLSAFVKVCQTSGNEKLKNISYDFLLNDNIQEIEAKNSEIYQSIGLSDDVINRLKQYNHPFYFDYSNIINYYFTYIPSNYWNYLNMLKISSEIDKKLDKAIKKNDIDIKDIKEIIKLINDERLLEYIERNFKNIYELYIKLNNNQKNIDIDDLKELKNLMEILVGHFKYKIDKINQEFLNNI